MKKFTLSALSVCLGVAAFAQVNQAYNLADSKSVYAKKTNVSAPVKKGDVKRSKAVFYTNDFSNTADWVIGTNDGTTDNWVIGTTAPSGSFPIDPIASTTAGNNFALFDSDLLCSGNQRAWVQLANPVDCSGHPAVAVEFEQHYRSFQDQTFVQVSTDGVNWTDFEVNTTIADNASTANPEVTSVNISSVAGNQPQVWIRFYFYSEAGVTGALGGCAYSWMVDDVSFKDVDPFDLDLTSVYWGTMGSWGARLPYTMIPVSQIQPIYFAGLVSNIGSNDQNDVVFTAMGGAYTGVSAITPIPAQTSDTLETLTRLTLPGVPGVTTVNFAVASSAADSDPSNNTASQSIEVTNTVYARDFGTIDGGSFNQGDGFEVGNVFDIFATTQTSSITFYPGATSNVGAQVYVRLYGGNFNYYAESDLYTLAAGDLGNAVTLNLQSPVDLIADSSYVIVVGSYGDGGLTNDLVVATSGDSEAQTSFFFDQTDQTWYYTTSTPMVRLNLVGEAGIIENKNVSSFSVSPNPAKENVSISYELTNETTVSIKVTDLSGKEVYASNLGTKTGKNSVSINTASFANGVYVVNFVTANGVVTEKLVINK